MPSQPESDGVLVPAVLGRAQECAKKLAEIAEGRGITVAVAESLTSGQLAAALGAAPDSAEWFRGGVVAYSSAVKHRVLGVPEVPVVSRPAASAMAEGVRELFDASIAAGVTGAGGPDGQDGEPPGSVWFAVAAADGVRAWHRQFDGAPEEVLDQVVCFGAELLLAAAAGQLDEVAVN
ncbi:CinA family protein [Nocardia donostiensis]|uniref:Competence protein n=1 Tax=Nocardia donostiensis TaxID=1538463 RepID=A0A1V2TH02_9NOCA|nr:CinA family protein [Nocardia donostiensis]ONM48785.1 competence protein [Nocardia donostiensis]OQS13015.1 competence protein [Nocardia donostiensis]OQS18203.1 competence protein [Nocardia donostiensis]